MNMAGILVVLVAVAAALPWRIAAVDHVIGGTIGWDIPSGGPSTYTTWASQNTFTVGDTLVFNFPTGRHDVAEVTKSAYDSCSSTAPISLVTVGPANSTLTSAGEKYYICTFGQHCSAGQKLAINVTAASTPSPVPSPATPTPTPTPTPAPTPSVVPTPTPAPTPTPTPTSMPTPSPSMGPSAAVSPGPSGGAGTLPSTPPPPGTIAPGTNPETPMDGLTPPPPPSAAPRNAFAPALIMFMSIATTFLW